MNHKTNRNFAFGLVVALVLGATAFGVATRADASPSRNLMPFSMLSSVQAAPATALSTSAATALAGFVQSAPSGSAAAEQVLTAARALPSGVDGHSAYLIPSRTGDLCFFVDGIGEACGPPLSPGNAVRIGEFDRSSNDAVGPMVFGYAADGVRSVTFGAANFVHTAAVHHNVFEFVEPSSVASNGVTNVTATFVDGHTSSIG